MSPNSQSSPQSSSPGATSGATLPAQPLTAIAILFVIIGIGGFAYALAIGLNSRAWEAYLVNLLFWMGIAQGGVVASAAFYLTQGRWAGRAHYRLAEAFSGFIILGFLLFWGLYPGRVWIFPWVTHPIAKKAAWLNIPTLFARDGFALFVMTVVSVWFVSASRSAEAGEWASTTKNILMPPKLVRRLAPAVGICFVFVYSLLAFDLVMSLSPLWHSSLFGWWFFVGTFWSALVTMAFTAVWLRRTLPPGNAFTHGRVLQDIGILIFGFSIFWAYTLFAQYIVIWYGDIPLETFFVLLRIHYWPWAFVGWLTLALVWGIPFFVLLGARPKRTPAILGTVALLGMIGIWAEIYVLVVPSLSPLSVPFGWVEVAVTAGFAGAFWLCSYPGLKLASAVAAEPLGDLES